MVSYEGKRTSTGTVVTRQSAEQTELPLRLDLAYHSPTGFEWSYGGSGPAQLALALLADALEDEAAAQALHQCFKWEVVAKLPQEGWRLTQESIREVVRDLQTTANPF